MTARRSGALGGIEISLGRFEDSRWEVYVGSLCLGGLREPTAVSDTDPTKPYSPPWPLTSRSQSPSSRMIYASVGPTAAAICAASRC